MRKLLALAAGAAALALSACGGQGDDTAGDNAAEAADAVADNLEEAADNTANDAAAEGLEDQADQVREAGEAKEEAVDDADVNAAGNTQ